MVQQPVQHKKYLMQIPLSWLVLVGIVIYGSLIAINSITRVRDFSPDSMNYVDVARNISSGKGIVQSTLGFNQPFLFQSGDTIPTPFTSQPPLYPVLIAFLGFFGLMHANAALIIPVLAYGAILAIAYRLSRDIYDRQTAIITVSFLLFYAPLMLVIRRAWSESLSIVFVLISFWLLLRRNYHSGNRIKAVLSLGAGLAAGLAFSTRYAMIPILLAGVLFYLIEFIRDPLYYRVTGRDFVLYVSGIMIPAGLVLGHNLLTSGRFLPGTLPSDKGFWTNLLFTAKAVFGNYYSNRGGMVQPLIAGILLLILLCISVIVLRKQRRLSQLLDVFVNKESYLLSVWSFLYLLFLTYQRTVSYFDAIGPRLIAPAGITLLILGAALLTKVIEPLKVRNNFLLMLLALSVVVACGNEVRVLLTEPVVSTEQRIENSERLKWIAGRAAQNILIIGDDTMDIPFYFAGKPAVSFSAYPYTLHLQYDDLMAFSNRNCREYQDIFLILRKLSTNDHDRAEYRYGEFISNLLDGNVSKYSEISQVASLSEATIYRVLCK
jgi:hypothetical protein